MNDERSAVHESSGRPVVVYRKRPKSTDDFLRHTCTAPDEETEQFVAAIYADRRASIESLADRE